MTEYTESAALAYLKQAELAAASLPETLGVAPRPIEAMGIVGSGTMGQGIAMAFANAGVQVHLLDIDQTVLDRGVAAIRRSYDASVRRGRLTAEDSTRRMALIHATTDYGDFTTADLAIEAVFEDMGLKTRILQQLDQVLKPGAVLATNTSTLDINRLAAATGRPADVVGLHFFSPAHATRLLEIVRTDTVSPDVMATALDIAKRIGKVGVVSKVSYGFIGNRMMEPYAREAERLVLEGATPAEVDAALEEFGFGMGILAVFDMAGVDVGVRARRANPDRLPMDDPVFYRASELLFEQGWLGQKTGRGFYRYEHGSRERMPHAEAIALLAGEGRRLGVARPVAIAPSEIVERCVFALINEGARLLEEGVALRASDIDVVYTAGYGFPRTRGGPMYYADQIGLATVLAGMQRYATSGNPADWRPAALLEQLARSGGTLANRSADGGAR